MALNYSDKMMLWTPDQFKSAPYRPYIESLGNNLDALLKESEDLSRQTYITESAGDVLDRHGLERGLVKVNYTLAEGQSLETDAAFRNRVRRIKYNRTKENIIDNVFSIIGITDVRVIDDYSFGDFLEGTKDKRTSQVTLDSSTYGNYGPLDLNVRNNCFSVFVDTPKRPPLSFFDANYFFDAKAFYDTKTRIFDESTARIIKTLIKAKAPAGSGFRIFIRNFTGINVGDENAQESDLNTI